MKIVFVKSFGFTIPLTLIGSFYGVIRIFVGLAFGNILAGLFASYEMKK